MGAKPVSLRIKSASVNGVIEHVSAVKRVAIVEHRSISRVHVHRIVYII